MFLKTVTNVPLKIMQIIILIKHNKMTILGRGFNYD